MRVVYFLAYLGAGTYLSLPSGPSDTSASPDAADQHRTTPRRRRMTLFALKPTVRRKRRDEALQRKARNNISREPAWNSDLSRDGARIGRPDDDGTNESSAQLDEARGHCTLSEHRTDYYIRLEVRLKADRSQGASSRARLTVRPQERIRSVIASIVKVPRNDVIVAQRRDRNIGLGEVHFDVTISRLNYITLSYVEDVVVKETFELDVAKRVNELDLSYVALLVISTPSLSILQRMALVKRERPLEKICKSNVMTTMLRCAAAGCAWNGPFDVGVCFAPATSKRFSGLCLDANDGSNFVNGTEKGIILVPSFDKCKALCEKTENCVAFGFFEPIQGVKLCCLYDKGPYVRGDDQPNAQCIVLMKGSCTRGEGASEDGCQCGKLTECRGGETCDPESAGYNVHHFCRCGTRPGCYMDQTCYTNSTGSFCRDMGTEPPGSTRRHQMSKGSPEDRTSEGSVDREVESEIAQAPDPPESDIVDRHISSSRSRGVGWQRSLTQAPSDDGHTPPNVRLPMSGNGVNDSSIHHTRHSDGERMADDDAGRKEQHYTRVGTDKPDTSDSTSAIEDQVDTHVPMHGRQLTSTGNRGDHAQVKAALRSRPRWPFGAPRRNLHAQALMTRADGSQSMKIDAFSMERLQPGERGVCEVGFEMQFDQNPNWTRSDEWRRGQVYECAHCAESCRKDDSCLLYGCSPLQSQCILYGARSKKTKFEDWVAGHLFYCAKRFALKEPRQKWAQCKTTEKTLIYSPIYQPSATTANITLEQCATMVKRERVCSQSFMWYGLDEKAQAQQRSGQASSVTDTTTHKSGTKVTATATKTTTMITMPTTSTTTTTTPDTNVWSSWSECSKTCGVGHRERQCVSRGSDHDRPEDALEECSPGDEKEYCNTDPCPPDESFSYSRCNCCTDSDGVDGGNSYGHFYETPIYDWETRNVSINFIFNRHLGEPMGALLPLIAGRMETLCDCMLYCEEHIEYGCNGIAWHENIGCQLFTSYSYCNKLTSDTNNQNCYLPSCDRGNEDKLTYAYIKSMTDCAVRVTCFFSLYSTVHKIWYDGVDITERMAEVEDMREVDLDGRVDFRSLEADTAERLPRKVTRFGFEYVEGAALTISGEAPGDGGMCTDGGFSLQCVTRMDTNPFDNFYTSNRSTLAAGNNHTAYDTEKQPLPSSKYQYKRVVRRPGSTFKLKNNTHDDDEHAKDVCDADNSKYVAFHLSPVSILGGPCGGKPLRLCPKEMTCVKHEKENDDLKLTEGFCAMTNQYCPWLSSGPERTSRRDWDYECYDGSYCGYDSSGDCCEGHGGRKKCPVNNPHMCAKGRYDIPTICAMKSFGCVNFGGLRTDCPRCEGCAKLSPDPVCHTTFDPEGDEKNVTHMNSCMAKCEGQSDVVRGSVMDGPCELMGEWGEWGNCLCSWNGTDGVQQRQRSHTYHYVTEYGRKVEVNKIYMQDDREHGVRPCKSEIICPTFLCECRDGTKSKIACKFQYMERCVTCFHGYHLSSRNSSDSDVKTGCVDDTITDGGQSNNFGNIVSHGQPCFCVLKQCSCDNGTAATGDSCSEHGTTQCESCDVGYHIEYTDTDRYGGKCEPNICTCNHGRAVPPGKDCLTHESVACTIDGCDIGFSFYSSRECKINNCRCANGEPEIGEMCGANGATFSCKLDGCKEGYHSVFDRRSLTYRCELNTCKCAHDTAFVAQGPRCRKHGATICTGCRDGFRSNGTHCFANGRCGCTNGTAAGCAEGEEYEEHCLECDAGYSLQPIIRSTKTHNICSANVCICDHGQAAVGPFNCTRNNTHTCASCDDAAYVLVRVNNDEGEGATAVCMKVPDPPPLETTKTPDPPPPLETTKEPDPPPPLETTKKPDPTPPLETTKKPDLTPPLETTKKPDPTPPLETTKKPDLTPPLETTKKPDPTPPLETTKKPDPTPPLKTTKKPDPPPPLEICTDASRCSCHWTCGAECSTSGRTVRGAARENNCMFDIKVSFTMELPRAQRATLDFEQLWNTTQMQLVNKTLAAIVLPPMEIASVTLHSVKIEPSLKHNPSHAAKSSSVVISAPQKPRRGLRGESRRLDQHPPKAGEMYRIVLEVKIRLAFDTKKQDFPRVDVAELVHVMKDSVSSPSFANALLNALADDPDDLHSATAPPPGGSDSELIMTAVLVTLGVMVSVLFVMQVAHHYYIHRKQTRKCKRVYSDFCDDISGMPSTHWSSEGGRGLDDLNAFRHCNSDPTPLPIGTRISSNLHHPVIAPLESVSRDGKKDKEPSVAVGHPHTDSPMRDKSDGSLTTAVLTTPSASSRNNRFTSGASSTTLDQHTPNSHSIISGSCTRGGRTNIPHARQLGAGARTRNRSVSPTTMRRHLSTPSLLLPPGRNNDQNFAARRLLAQHIFSQRGATNFPRTDASIVPTRPMPTSASSDVKKAKNLSSVSCPTRATSVETQRFRITPAFERHVTVTKKQRTLCMLLLQRVATLMRKNTALEGDLVHKVAEKQAVRSKVDALNAKADQLVKLGGQARLQNEELLILRMKMLKLQLGSHRQSLMLRRNNSSRSPGSRSGAHSASPAAVQHGRRESSRLKILRFLTPKKPTSATTSSGRTGATSAPCTYRFGGDKATNTSKPKSLFDKQLAGLDHFSLLMLEARQQEMLKCLLKRCVVLYQFHCRVRDSIKQHTVALHRYTEKCENVAVELEAIRSYPHLSARMAMLLKINELKHLLEARGFRHISRRTDLRGEEDEQRLGPLGERRARGGDNADGAQTPNNAVTYKHCGRGRNRGTAAGAPGAFAYETQARTAKKYGSAVENPKNDDSSWNIFTIGGFFK